MIRFECDYAEGAHSKVLEKIVETNFLQTAGYGVDEYCQQGREIIKKLCGANDVDVHFVVGGTQANTIVISSILRPYQGVISASTGHVAVHETGSIEATGHKVLTIPSDDGKITAQQVEKEIKIHFADSSHEHMVQPAMVYISNPTENGTIYSKSELIELSRICRENGVPLFMDGARLGYGLMAKDNDLTIEDIAKLCDVFYIGGTKVGALFGEAIVITNEKLKTDFRYNIKQRGGMFAKGRLLGLQFIALLEDGLYFEVSKHANEMAELIENAFRSKGCEFRYKSSTNQRFPAIANDKLKLLGEKYAYSFWEKYDECHSVVRFCTSWATKREDVDSLIEDIKKLL